MMRPTLTFHVKFLSVAIAAFTSLTACGNEMQLTDTDSSTMMELAISDSDGTLENLAMHTNSTIEDASRVTDGNTCADIMATIHAHREAVAATDAWKTFAATDAWQQVKTDGIVLKRLKCKYNDENPSYACAQMAAKIKTHFAAAQATDAYKACTELPVWQELVKNYDEARENQCLPSQNRDTAAL
jgi:hypothetical protein